MAARLSKGSCLCYTCDDRIESSVLEKPLALHAQCVSTQSFFFNLPSLQVFLIELSVICYHIFLILSEGWLRKELPSPIFNKVVKFVWVFNSATNCPKCNHILSCMFGGAFGLTCIECVGVFPIMLKLMLREAMQTSQCTFTCDMLAKDTSNWLQENLFAWLKYSACGATYHQRC
eukprot:6142631-Amphidinium_carterae.1